MAVKVRTFLRSIAQAVFLMAVFSLTASTSEAQDIDARELVRKVETQYQGETSHSVARMTVVTENWTRELTMEMWSEGRDKFIAYILAPKKEEGTGTLKINDEMWNYLPRIDRLIKIPSSLMGDSWMGSHLTNDDLVKENKIDELYDLSVASKKDDVVTIVGIPKPDAAVVWGKLEYTVDTGKMIPLSVLYYDEDGALVRTMTFDKVEKISGRWLPLLMVVKPEDKPDEKTELIYDSLEFGVKLGADRFSIRSLRGR